MRYNVDKIVPVTQNVLPEDLFAQFSNTIMMPDGRRMIITITENAMDLEVEMPATIFLHSHHLPSSYS
jgi:hypothetical protein